MRQWLRLALVFLASVTCAWATPAWAGVAAGTLPVQGVLRTSAGGAVADGVYAVTVSLYDQQVGGTAIWKQPLAAVPVVGGLFAFDIGGDPLAPPLPTALTESPTPLWFGIQIGSDPELPRSAIGWVPRAFWANVAGTAQSVTCSGCIGASQIAIGSIDADKVAFTYAASASAGGPAASALNADTAKDLNCTGCVELSDLAASVTGAYLPITGGALSGTSSLTVPGALTVKQVVDFTNAVIIGGRFGANGNGVCDPAHSGAFAWDTATKRFSLCDGTTARKVPFCDEACKDPTWVACGTPVPDLCGDANINCASAKGTQCPINQQCLSGGCQSIPATSCQAIHQANISLGSGTYTIDPDGAGGLVPFQVYCDMTGDGGGWTLVLKINGANQTFSYDSANWNSASVIAPSAVAGIDSIEHKSAAFSSLPFTAIRWTMAFNSQSSSMTSAQSAASLQAFFSDESYRSTAFGRPVWQGLMQNGSMLPNCNHEGFNVRSSAYNPTILRARIGMVTNNENDCVNPDAVIGIGLAGDACGSLGTNLNNAAGNIGYCGSTPSENLNNKAWAYVFIR